MPEHLTLPSSSITSTISTWPTTTPPMAMLLALPEPDVARARRALVTAAHADLGAAMTLAVPFVLAHPDEATVLRELAVIAGSTPSGPAVFGARVGELIRTASHDDTEPLDQR